MHGILPNNTHAHTTSPPQMLHTQRISVMSLAMFTFSSVSLTNTNTYTLDKRTQCCRIVTILMKSPVYAILNGPNETNRSDSHNPEIFSLSFTHFACLFLVNGCDNAKVKP